MLKMISWMSFLTWIGTLAVVYYLVVFARYYKWEIFSFLTGKTVKVSPSATRQKDDDEKPELFTAMQKAIAALRESLQDATRDGGNRENALSAVKRVLNKYTYLKNTPYALAIDHFLVRKTHESVRLNEDELKELWA